MVREWRPLLALAGARSAHANIVQVSDAGRSEDGTMYIAMALLLGDYERGLLRRTGPFAHARTLAVVVDIASALAAAHACGVIQRDLKAENVMHAGARRRQAGDRCVA